MRQLKILWLLSVGVSAAISVDVLTARVAQAQDVRILYPQEGQDVRGEITARFEGIPAGGYAVIKIDGQFRQASAQDFVVLDTLSDRVSFARGDAPYKLDITVLNAGGKRVGTSSVTFNVANSKVETGGTAVRLVHWTPSDRLGDVQRFRVFAESNATTSGGASAGGAMAGATGGAAPTIDTSLDWQVSALMRRVLRDANLLSGAANIQTIVQEGFQRQRQGTGAGGAGGEGAMATPVATTSKKAASKSVGKAPWNQDPKGNALWDPAPETGKYFIKMIQQNGTEINATRKAPSLAIADLLPTFPDVAVRPGSTWGTTMSFVGELSSRAPINVKDAPMTFTAYEDLQTPAGESRRCAKLESRFRLPDNLAKRIAVTLANKSSATGGAAPSNDMMPGAAPAAPTGEAGATGTLTEDDILVARTDVARVLWFDVQRRRILRAEDTIRSNFEKPAAAAGEVAGAMPEMGGEASAAPAEPERVSYNLSVTTWLDDRVPNPTGLYLPGGAGAHTRDSVAEPGLSRILRSNVASP